MEPQPRKLLQTLVFAVLYAFLFLILMPPLLRVMDQSWGKALYGVLVAGAVAIAFRLRALLREGN
jgi:hypothetical protein